MFDMTLRIHSQTSTIATLKFGNGYVITPHNFVPLIDIHLEFVTEDELANASFIFSDHGVPAKVALWVVVVTWQSDIEENCGQPAGNVHSNDPQWYNTEKRLCRTRFCPDSMYQVNWVFRSLNASVSMFYVLEYSVSSIYWLDSQYICYAILYLN